MTEPEKTAIPTLYGGIQFRSRLEADTAFLLDRLGIRYAYECRSYLLASGAHFRPDFKLEPSEPLLPVSHGSWAGECFLEVRGYDKPDGNQQIVDFCDEVFAGRYGNLLFFVVGKEGQIPLHAFHFTADSYPQFSFKRGAVDTHWYFSRCHYCGNWTPTSQTAVPCISCGAWTRHNTEILPLNIRAGVLSLVHPDTLEQYRASRVNPLDFVDRVL